MPIVTIQVDAGASGVMTRAKTVSGADLVRFIAAVRKVYVVPVSSSDIEALQIWADDVYSKAVATTKGQEQAVAAAGVTPIGFA